MSFLRITSLACLFGLSSVAMAEPLSGSTWRTFDDATGKPKVVVQFESKGGVLVGTITQRLEGSTITNCVKCSGALKNRPLVGLPIISGLKASGSNEYDQGEILDPLTGKIYKLKAKLSADGKTLEMRGFIGFSLLGRTQTWKRDK